MDTPRVLHADVGEAIKIIGTSVHVYTVVGGGKYSCRLFSVPANSET